jgi:hypothetical protein
VSTANSYLVLISQDKTILSFPDDGKTYKKGDQLLNAKVAYVGDDTIFIPKGIRANSTYSFLIFAFNGSGGQENYLQIKPTVGSVSTGGLSIGSYYEELSKTAPNFISALSELINPHKVIPYTNYKTTLLQNLELMDTINGQQYIECVYSGERKIVSEPFDWVKSGYSREHTFPHSWMPSYPADNPPLPEYSDLHNLYPTNLDKANSIRSNYPLGEINGKVTFEYLEGRLGYNGNQLVYEPRDKHKGNVARAIFYMCIAYNGKNNHSWELPNQQNQEILKQWHFNFPPDSYEIARQEYIYSLQGNRNPFVDSANYVCAIDFSKLTKVPFCKQLSNSILIDEMSVSKLPFELSNSLLCFIDTTSITSFEIRNILGEKINFDVNNSNCYKLHEGISIISYELDSNKYSYKVFTSDL